MAENESRITLSIQDGRLEIVGSEAFVAKQIERFEEVIRRSLSGTAPRSPRPTEKEVTPPATQGDQKEEDGESLGEYDHVFAVADNDKIQVIAEIPGTSDARKMVAAAELVAFASSLQGVDEVPFEDIRAVCKQHDFLDGGNFSPTLKDEKGLFVIGGSTRKQTLKLTPRGKRAARELAQSLNTQ